MWAMKIVGKCDCHSDSHIAGSYILEALLIHPIYAPLKYYYNLRYSMQCIFKLIFFCSSSKTKIWLSATRTPGTLPWLRPCIEQYLLNPLQVPGVIESRSTWLCCISKRPCPSHCLVNLVTVEQTRKQLKHNLTTVFIMFIIL